MRSALTIQVLCMLAVIVPSSRGRSDWVGNNAFEALDSIGCLQFKAIITEAKLEGIFTSNQAITVFVFNDTTYNMMPDYRRGTFYNDTESQVNAEEYLDTFILMEAVETSSFSDAAPYPTYSTISRKLFLNTQSLRIGNDGLPGPTKYFCNGATITEANIIAGQHVIHIIDQVLDVPYPQTALAYVSGYNAQKLAFQFYSKLMSILQQAPQEDGEYNYNKQVQRVLTGAQVTFFIPSDEALNQIPAQKLSELQGNPRLMLDIITHHIVPNQVLYTSLVNHNEQFNTQFNSGAVVFKKFSNRVFVTGALSSGRTVTTSIINKDLTVLNGVVHQIDGLLGFVYRSALEEIQVDPETQIFEELINAASKELFSDLASLDGVTVFAPTNKAFRAIANTYPGYISNQSLIDMVLQMSMLMQGQRLSLMDYNAGNESYKTAVSRYNGSLIKAYSEGNDIWVEGGYVRARVVKPDIGVTNGVVHQIDAVFGIPTRDIPHTISCRDWLDSTFIQMKKVGLDEYMRDEILINNLPCEYNDVNSTENDIPQSSTTVSPINITTTSYNQNNQQYGICGEGQNRCEFTFFVPNGSAIDNFAQTQYGRLIMNDVQRWRWLLRRLIIREKVYLDQVTMGAPKSLYVDNGEEIILQIDSRSSIPSGVRDAYIMFEGIRAKIIRSDIGATNGVIHIISSLLFVPEDLTRDVNETIANTTVNGTFASTTVNETFASTTVNGIISSSTAKGHSESTTRNGSSITVFMDQAWLWWLLLVSLCLQAGNF